MQLAWLYMRAGGWTRYAWSCTPRSPSRSSSRGLYRARSSWTVERSERYAVLVHAGLTTFQGCTSAASFVCPLLLLVFTAQGPYDV